MTQNFSTISSLLLNDKGDTVSMSSMIPAHEVKTVAPKYSDEEAAEAQ